ncbi:uncharacterized protein LOC141902352 [Tubulanus polymorphus]|uniref:uncharacterized protein LOC141902352 n=1 Tax=Tubulanus polymorphus TaxID=672921 RepID=UPI003DA57D89
MNYNSPICVLLALAFCASVVFADDCYFKFCKNDYCRHNTKCTTKGPCYKQVGTVDGIAWELKGCYSPYVKCNEGNITYTGGLKLDQYCCTGHNCNSADKSTLALSSLVLVTVLTFVIHQLR